MFSIGGRRFFEQTKRIPQRNHRLAKQQVIIRRELHGLEFLSRFAAQLQQGHVARAGGDDAVGLILAAIAQLDPDAIGLAHDVIIGQDKAALVDDHAAAHAVLGLGWKPAVIGAVKFAQQIGKLPPAIHQRLGRHVDNAGEHFFHGVDGGVTTDIHRLFRSDRAGDGGEPRQGGHRATNQA
jgi:hypothetical protein